MVGLPGMYLWRNGATARVRLITGAEVDGRPDRVLDRRSPGRGRRPHDPAAAAALRPWWNGVSDRAEAAALLVDRQQGEPADLAAARAETIGGVQRLTTALLAAVGGGGAMLSHPAQRLAREALFYVVQAQNADGRRATLESLIA